MSRGGGARRRATAVAAGVALAGALQAQSPARPAPRSIEALRSAVVETRLRDVRALGEGRSFTARLVSYPSGALTVHALVATPRSAPPPGGFPVIVANHGTHPDPPRYGFGADGTDARPGDYYRAVPELYASRGFIVVMPDYRGHNSSQGVEFARGFLASAYYTEDVLALLGGLREVAGANPDRVFMWGHSLGGEVTLRTLLATTIVKGASLWSTVGGDVWEQAYHYGRSRKPDGAGGTAAAEGAVDALRRDMRALGEGDEWAAREPWAHLRHLRAPIVLHHAIGDRGAKHEWSERLATLLYLGGHRYEFWSYPGSDHFFQGAAQEQAADRDVRFFRSIEDEGARGAAAGAAPAAPPRR